MSTNNVCFYDKFTKDIHQLLMNTLLNWATERNFESFCYEVYRIPSLIRPQREILNPFVMKSIDFITKGFKISLCGLIKDIDFITKGFKISLCGLIKEGIH